MEPTVSVVIPCRNEEKYIEDCIVSIFNQVNLGDFIEIIVVDGMSEDRTTEIVKSLCQTNKNLKLIENPKKITPAGMNLGIQKSKGKYIAIFGAHSKYAEDYLYNCLKLFESHPEVFCVGGPITSTADTPFGKSVALAMSSRIGVGNAKHRFSDYEGYAEGACFPVFRKEVFDLVGMYDEDLKRNQDDELNFRLKKNNLKIFISKKILSFYSVRELPSRLYEQYFDYGFWRIAVIKKHKRIASLRQVAPLIFFVSVILLIILASLLSSVPFIFALALPSIYLFVLFLYCTSALFIHRELKVACFFPYAVFIMHLAYAHGFLIGLHNYYLKAKK